MHASELQINNSTTKCAGDSALTAGKIPAMTMHHRWLCGVLSLFLACFLDQHTSMDHGGSK